MVRVHQYSDGRDCYQTGQSSQDVLHGALTVQVSAIPPGH
ncbi:general secretion pathway protein GspL [Salmonella enterica subsp. enterica serovar Oranienburg]|nr:general secretion pathway protein GspL [Salmonella enterica subsp. enterica serovar Pomona]EAA8400023.1 general secretion pathway protein GspL [Salmonella enterica subsp. enterica serovar Oranienburg]EAA8418823.1 general secretion pathway protein GspL [Salmonella enterica subsp. enterica]EAM4339420.1 general secretion pathway protein GspL [Salmonella enterica subsp. enterica serovar Minnesota]EAM5644953.1 general secretion pathway protein GspL [Salmonella enterica]EAN3246990.1 general secre